MGDPTGIGPEVILKALSILPDHNHSYIVYGHRPSFQIPRLDKLSLERQFFEIVPSISYVSKPGKFFIETTQDGEITQPINPDSALSGQLSIRALELASEDLIQGNSDTLVTAPISKKAIHDAGFTFPGHTEYLGYYFGAEKVMMMLVHQKLKVALQTIHIPLSEVSSLLSSENLISTLQFLYKTLRVDFAISDPIIDVLGLNPHAGDQGVLGNEEQTLLLPAIEQVRSSGVTIGGPYAADGYFARNSWKKADAVLAMYHDQGLIPFKMLDEGAGVNMTAGLPFVRTSPDHGTAFDIANKGIASAKSMMMAIQLAVNLTENRISHDHNHLPS